LKPKKKFKNRKIKPQKEKKFKKIKVEPKKTTQTVEFESVSELKDHANACKQSAVQATNQYKQFILNAVGAFPRDELQLLEFIEKVLKLHEVIEDD
jgi:hypothetical protein